MKFKILLADDDVDILDVMSEELKYYEYEVITCKSGQEAIAILKNQTIGLIISDYKMINGNGLALLEYVNEMKIRPLFFFFTSEENLNNEELKKIGLDKVYLKPFGFNQLILDIKKEVLNQRN